VNGNQRPLFYKWNFTVLPPQITIACIPPKCAINYTTSTVWYNAVDSSAIPQIKVCYYQNSALNGGFPTTETVGHGPNAIFGTMSATTTSLITIYDGPLAQTNVNQTITLGDGAYLSGLQSSGTLAGIAGYSWSPPTALSCTNCATTVASPSVTTEYVLTVIDKNGCIDTAHMMVFVDEFCFEPFVPTAFSPNGDKENDKMYVRSNCLKNFSFKIFDRWGEKVFETNDLNHGWDGTFRNEPMNAAVFVYTLEGYLSNGKEVKKKGNITLVR
jgi:gliding motility-associated-like protein